MWILLSASGTEPASSLDPWTGLFLGLVLIGLNGFFVAAEFGLAKLRPTQLEPRVKRRERRALLVDHMLRHLDAYLSASQLGITLASIALGWVGEPAFSWLLRPLLERLPGVTDAFVHSASLTLAFVTISVLHIVVGEQVPKTFAIRLPEATSLGIAVPLYLFYWAAFPVIWLLNLSANSCLRLIGMKPASEHELAHSEEELRLLLASRHGSRISQQKRDLLENVFELSDRIVRQVMIPRSDVVYLTTSASTADNLALARASGHTRFPLCEGDLDRIVGLIHIKDLFRAEQVPDDLRKIARPVKFVPETTPLDTLLTRMRSERLHIAAVLDEYGGVAGVVTLENVIEEIVGSIQDEFDTEKPELVAKGDGVYQVSGAMLVVDLEDELGIEFSARDEDTIGGVVLSELGRRPRVGDRAELGPLRLEVLEVHGHRIHTLRASVVSAAPRQPG